MSSPAAIVVGAASSPPLPLDVHSKCSSDLTTGLQALPSFASVAHLGLQVSLLGPFNQFIEDVGDFECLVGLGMPVALSSSEHARCIWRFIRDGGRDLCSIRWDKATVGHRDLE